MEVLDVSGKFDEGSLCNACWDLQSLRKDPFYEFGSVQVEIGSFRGQLSQMGLDEVRCELESAREEVEGFRGQLELAHVKSDQITDAMIRIRMMVNMGKVEIAEKRLQRLSA